MKLYFVFRKRTLAAVAAVIILMTAVAGQLCTPAQSGREGATNALRREFAYGIGYDISDECLSVKEIVIPSEFNDVYCRYNELQKQAGFDLEPHQGENAVIYTYSVGSGEEKAFMNIIVAGGIIIGGDISTADFNGYMKPLKET